MFAVISERCVTALSSKKRGANVFSRKLGEGNVAIFPNAFTLAQRGRSRSAAQTLLKETAHGSALPVAALKKENALHHNEYAMPMHETRSTSCTPAVHKVDSGFHLCPCSGNIAYTQRICNKKKWPSIEGHFVNCGKPGFSYANMLASTINDRTGRATVL